jgi:hypothetical protein
MLGIQTKLCGSLTHFNIFVWIPNILENNPDDDRDKNQKRLVNEQ